MQPLSKKLFVITPIVQAMLLLLLQNYSSWLGFNAPLMTFICLFIVIFGFVLLAADSEKSRCYLFVGAFAVGLYGALVNAYVLHPWVGCWLGVSSTIGLYCFLLAYHSSDSTQVSYFELVDTTWNTITLLVGLFVFSLFVCFLFSVFSAVFVFFGTLYVAQAFLSNQFIWFITPIILALGVYFLRSRASCIPQLRLLVQLVCKIFLFLLTLFAALYVLGIIFGSLVLGHNNFYAAVNSSLLPLVAFFGVILINGVYQSGKDIEQVKPIFRMCITLLSACLSFFMVCSLVHIVTQWQAVLMSKLVGVLAVLLYVLCYFVLSLRSGDRWMKATGLANNVISILFIAAVFFLQNPVSYYRYLAMVPITAPGTPLQAFGFSGGQARVAMPVISVSAGGFSWHAHDQLQGKIKTRLGYADQYPLYACRTQYKGSMQPGQLKNGVCLISFAWKSFSAKQYEVLTGQQPIIWKDSYYVYQAKPRFIPLVAGRDINGDPLILCRTTYNYTVHIGKVVSWACDISVNGREVRSQPYQIATFKKIVH